MENIIIISRSFQGGVKEDSDFDLDQFLEKVAKPIQKIGDDVRIVVVTNTEAGHKLAEGVASDGSYPTGRALAKVFSNEVESGRIIPIGCDDWGPNPGSPLGLNAGARFAIANSADWIMNWSPEIEMTPGLINQAMQHQDRHGLDVVGFFRTGWYERAQWKVPQNTASIWRANLLSQFDFFDRFCTGETGETVSTEEYGDVPLAGMEDFHLMLRVLASGYPLRWGMVCRRNPLLWDTKHFEGERLLNHLKKVARQWLVMRAYVERVCPNEDVDAVLERFFGCFFQE